MAKGDDAVMRKKNKANRKKLNKDPAVSVSARVASIIAAKKRRKSGKRSQCQGMCFSLPTPEDPFNDTHGKKELKENETKKVLPSRAAKKEFSMGKCSTSQNGTLGPNGIKVDRVKHKEVNAAIVKEGKIQKNGEGGIKDLNGEFFENFDSPSKFLILCLNAIENSFVHDSNCNGGEAKPLFFSTWGVEFWKCYSVGKDVLETSGSSSTTEKISWIISSAADAITRKEKDNLSFSNPFLLFLVPNQEKAIEVRSLCKPLKALGIHTVSIHSGASLDHQIQGLKSCEPEFLVSTPERLLDLVSLKAIDISGVSMLVIDGLDSFSRSGSLDATKVIRQSILGNPQTVVFNDGSNSAYVPVVQNLLRRPIHRLSPQDFVASQSACIVQSINFCSSEEDKQSQFIQAVDSLSGNKSMLSEVLCVMEEEKASNKLVATLKSKGYSISNPLLSPISELKNRSTRPGISIIHLHDISEVNLDKYEVVFILSFALSVDNYIQILTRMARFSVNGILQTFITKKEAPVAAALVSILEECRQVVPKSLRDLCLLI